MATYYVITVRGHLAEHWSNWFEGLTITNAATGEALLAGPVADQAALHGLLIKIRDLGLPLLSVLPGRPPEDDGAGHGAVVGGPSEPRSSATEVAASPASHHPGA